jgi:energy-coupling factor transporter transmembrane protein EcfT
MAELTLWGYRSGATWLHRLDPRFGLLIMLTISLTLLQVRAAVLFLFSIGCVALLRYLGVEIKPLIGDLKIILLLLLIIVVARALVTPGRTLLSMGAVTISREGIATGFLIAWRLLIVVLVGALFMFSTPPSAVKAAVEWYLRPVPGIPQAKVGLMLGLLLRFIPLIFRQSIEVGDAQRARGVETIKNPLRRIMLAVIPLMRRLFLTADHLATAMTARGYTEQRTPPRLKATALDWSVLVVVGLVCAAGILWSGSGAGAQ